MREAIYRDDSMQEVVGYLEYDKLSEEIRELARTETLLGIFVNNSGILLAMDIYTNIYRGVI